jgi:hypothetical protein
MWRGIKQPWFLTFTLTWLVVIVLLQLNGMAPTPSARYALLAALASGGLVWLVLRNRVGPPSDTTGPSDRDR